MGVSERRLVSSCVVLVLTLAGCSRTADVPTINASMTGVMEPQAEKIWDLVSAAYNDVGDGLIGRKISDADWQKIEAASLALKQRADVIEQAEHIYVADANEPILGSQAVGVKSQSGSAWEAVDASTVQSRIDARPDLFKQKAHVLVAAADTIHRAAQTKDAALLYKAASGMDEVCDGCHEPFWGTDEPPPFPGEHRAIRTQVKRHIS
jgi:hypothetical protein